jgi:hypothetical protein
MSPIQGKIKLNDFEKILADSNGKSLDLIENEFIISAGMNCDEVIHEMFTELKEFIYTEPKIPDTGKEYATTEYLNISIDDTREKIITKIHRLSKKAETALLALYVYRDMEMIDWLPFIKASIERNPVAFNNLSRKSSMEVFEALQKLSEESIYEGKRLALPDEVWNFRHGDGLEKAILMACIIHHHDHEAEIKIDSRNKKVILHARGESFRFNSRKGFDKLIKISGDAYSVENL